MPRFENLLKEGQPKNFWPALFGLFAGVFLIFVAWNAPIIAAVFAFKLEMPYEIANFAIELKFLILVLFFGFGVGLLAMIFYRKKLQKMPAISLFTAAPKFRIGLVLIGIALTSLITFGGVIFFEPNYIEKMASRFLQLGTVDFVLLASAYLAAFAVQSTFEETYFRGFLTQYLRRLSIPLAVVIVITSLLFSAVHYSPKMPMPVLGAVLFSAFLMGLTFAVAAWRTNGLEVTIGAHIANNFIVGGLFGALDNQQASEEAYLSAIVFAVLYLGGLELALRLRPKFLADSRLTGTAS
ncbi:MAG: type II CAAX endopeptidase family protein [Pseudomonadota bacterium]